MFLMTQLTSHITFYIPIITTYTKPTQIMYVQVHWHHKRWLTWHSPTLMVSCLCLQPDSKTLEWSTSEAGSGSQVIYTIQISWLIITTLIHIQMLMHQTQHLCAVVIDTGACWCIQFTSTSIYMMYIILGKTDTVKWHQKLMLNWIIFTPWFSLGYYIATDDVTRLFFPSPKQE